MDGNNELRLCRTEMDNALQMYVEHLMPKADVKVQSVEQKDDVFIVKLAQED